mgnify:CR=1 FL=1
MGLDLEAALARRRAQGLYRSRRVTEGPQGPELVIDGRRMLAFCSNDYLGLANHPEVVAAFRRGLQILTQFAQRYGKRIDERDLLQQELRELPEVMPPRRVMGRRRRVTGRRSRAAPTGRPAAGPLLQANVSFLRRSPSYYCAPCFLAPL